MENKYNNEFSDLENKYIMIQKIKYPCKLCQLQTKVQSQRVNTKQSYSSYF